MDGMQFSLHSYSSSNEANRPVVVVGPKREWIRQRWTSRCGVRQQWNSR